MVFITHLIYVIILINVFNLVFFYFINNSNRIGGKCANKMIYINVVIKAKGSFNPPENRTRQNIQGRASKTKQRHLLTAQFFFGVTPRPVDFVFETQNWQKITFPRLASKA